MNRRTTVCVLCLLFMAKCQGASVAWNNFTLSTHWQKDSYAIEAMYYGTKFHYNPYVAFQVHLGEAGSPLSYWLYSIDYSGSLAGYMNNWVKARQGDVIDETTTRHMSSYFNNSNMDGHTGYNMPITGTVGEDIYLMFAVADNYGVQDPISALDQDVLYGWVHLYIADSGQVVLRDSAMGLDGQAMVVGEGAIPEPTTGSLIAMGLALLAFRRRVVWQPRLNFRAKI